jgi:hypothetical protein
MAARDCGLYRTGIALGGPGEQEEQVGSGLLVYFHNHSDEGPPMVVTPHANSNNRWQFHERGWTIEDNDFVAALIPLKPEGLYVNAEHLHISREEIIPPRTLMQLGYNRRADSILFVARFEDNTISFPSSGYSFTSPDLQKHLQPVGFNVPQPKPPEALH